MRLLRQQRLLPRLQDSPPRQPRRVAQTPPPRVSGTRGHPEKPVRPDAATDLHQHGCLSARRFHVHRAASVPLPCDRWLSNTRPVDQRRSAIAAARVDSSLAISLRIEYCFAMSGTVVSFASPLEIDDNHCPGSPATHSSPTSFHRTFAAPRPDILQRNPSADHR